MSLVGRVGRKRLRARLAMAALYALLSVGAVTTVYPFALMATTGFKGPTDQNDNALVPKFWSGGPELLKKYLDDKYSGDASKIESARIGAGASPAAIQRYEAFLESLPLDHWAAGFAQAPNQVTSKLNRRYVSWLRGRFRTIDALNRAYVEENVGFQTVEPPTELLERRDWRPDSSRKYAEWLQFKALLPVEYRIPVRAQFLFDQFVRGKFQGQFDRVPRSISGSATRFEQIEMPSRGTLADEFRRTRLPARYANSTVETLWARFAGSPEPMPIAPYESKFVESHAAEIEREFSSRNYSYVVDYILLNGRALWNTAIFCLLAIGTQLVVNPLAAYALSRYPIRASAKILVFLLATMAFPAEVAMIPSFLLLKNLGLLNTFAALVLPSAASGYMIFLLKGFFDSLPQELFEAAQIDGARESTTMLRIALPLSKPVLGYLALIAFMGAYGSFIYAFLVAQDQRMWTLMVFVYQLQTVAPKSVTMAALAVSALPTLIVFLAAQRVIDKGIILPGER